MTTKLVNPLLIRLVTAATAQAGAKARRDMRFSVDEGGAAGIFLLGNWYRVNIDQRDQALYILGEASRSRDGRAFASCSLTPQEARHDFDRRFAQLVCSVPELRETWTQVRARPRQTRRLAQHFRPYLRERFPVALSVDTAQRVGWVWECRDTNRTMFLFEREEALRISEQVMGFGRASEEFEVRGQRAESLVVIQGILSREECLEIARRW